MSLTPSTMQLPAGASAPGFSLPDTEGRIVSLDDFTGAPALLVMFICNHCPYVQHVREELSRLVKEYQAKGVAAAGINSNDAANYPGDSPEKMKEEVATAGYTFPYLIDETQEVAKAYYAACTPDLYVFDKDRKLAYCGQFDGSRPGGDVPVTGADLRAALDAVLEGRSAPRDQIPSMGCNIKWKKGNEPDYFNR